MRLLRKAIVDYFNNNSSDFKTAVAKLYHQEIPQGTASPNARFFIVDVNDDYLLKERLERIEVQFDVFDEDNPGNANIAEQAAEYCYNFFQDCASSLTIVGYEIVAFHRIQTITLPEDEGGDKIWQVSQMFEVILRKQS